MGVNNNVSTVVISDRYTTKVSEDGQVTTQSTEELSQSASDLKNKIVNSRNESGETPGSTNSDQVLSDVDNLINQESTEAAESTATQESAPPAPKKETYPTSLDGIKGLSGRSMHQLKDTDELIANQLAKYEKMAAENDAPEIKRKVTFWKHQQMMQEKIKGRLKNKGLAGEHLKNTFTNFFTNRTKLLRNKAKQGPFAENKGSYYKHLEKNNAVLSQLASGASWKQVQSNMHLVDSMSKKVAVRHEAVEKLTDSIKSFRKELGKKGISQKRRDTIKAKLKELHEKRNEQRDIKRQLLTIIRKLGGRGHKLNATERAQYAGALRDIEALKGDAILDELP